MTCRALTDADAAQAIVLFKELVGDIPVAGAAHFSEMLAHPGTIVMGAFAGHRLAALATLHVLPNMPFDGRPYGLVENVVTARDLRGQGYGRQVMEAVATHAWARDCYKLMLLTGRTLGARGFYESLGYTADEKWGMTLRRAGPRRPLP